MDFLLCISSLWDLVLIKFFTPAGVCPQNPQFVLWMFALYLQVEFIPLQLRTHDHYFKLHPFFTTTFNVIIIVTF